MFRLKIKDMYLSYWDTQVGILSYEFFNLSSAISFSRIFIRNLRLLSFKMITICSIKFARVPGGLNTSLNTSLKIRWFCFLNYHIIKS
jgi:hypothetical protein